MKYNSLESSIEFLRDQLSDIPEKEIHQQCEAFKKENPELFEEVDNAIRILLKYVH